MARIQLVAANRMESSQRKCLRSGEQTLQHAANPQQLRLCLSLAAGDNEGEKRKLYYFVWGAQAAVFRSLARLLR